MRKFYISIITLVILSLHNIVYASDWYYDTQLDNFTNSTIKKAILRSNDLTSSIMLLFIQTNETKNLSASILIKNYVSCFNGCIIFVKVDEKDPVAFNVKSDKIINTYVSVETKQISSFITLLNSGEKYTIRIRTVNSVEDINFRGNSQFNPSNWELAETKKIKIKKCEENAIIEDYSVCMSK